MVNEDLPECAPPPRTFTTVDFEYTYNMSGAETGLYQDWFNEHAGSAYLYVFDKKGTYLFNRQTHKTDMNPNLIDFSIVLDDKELVPGNEYMLVGMAQGNHAGYEASLETPGFTLLHEMIPGVSTIDEYRVKLDRDDDGTYDFGIINYKDAYGNNYEKMDTLWSTKPNSVQLVDIPYIAYKPQVTPLPDNHVHVTIPMMRITNSIKVNLVNDLFDQDTDPDSYNIIIDFPNGNGTIGFTGATDPAQRLIYRSLRKEVKQYTPKSNGAQYDAYGAKPEEDYVIEVPVDNNISTRANTYCINAEFGVSRLQKTDGSSLVIYDAATGEEVARIDNFSAWLADYFDHRYDDQEFLDREYDFTVDIHMNPSSDKGYDWIQAGVAILGWGKRIQNIDW